MREEGRVPLVRVPLEDSILPAGARPRLKTGFSLRTGTRGTCPSAVSRRPMQEGRVPQVRVPVEASVFPAGAWHRLKIGF